MNRISAILLSLAVCVAIVAARDGFNGFNGMNGMNGFTGFNGFNGFNGGFNGLNGYDDGFLNNGGWNGYNSNSWGRYAGMGFRGGRRRDDIEGLSEGGYDDQQLATLDLAQLPLDSNLPPADDNMAVFTSTIDDPVEHIGVGYTDDNIMMTNHDV